jgi:antitoxin component YwqK of YwqJK toxin-antitoxin module
MIHGEGIVRYADGSKFKGVFKEGRRNGPAIEQDKEGKRFEGSYVDDRRDGPFVEKDANGNVTSSGRYVRGRREVNK